MNNGGPAFPLEYRSKNSDQIGDEMQSIAFGMTLRQWYAGKALQGLLASGSSTKSLLFELQELAIKNNNLPECLAESSFSIADMMIAYEMKGVEDE